MTNKTNPLVSHLQPPDYSWLFNSANSFLTLVSSAVIVGGVFVYLLTRPRSTQSIEDDYYHFTQRLQITTINLELKFANNPLFRSFKLFSYNGNGKFEVSGHIVPLPSNIYEEKKKGDDITEVRVNEKSLLKHNTVSKLRVVLERKRDDRATKINPEFSHDRIAVINSNDIPVKNYKIELPDKLTQNNRENLEKDPRVDEVFPEGDKWYMTIKEVKEKTLSEAHREVFRF
ncbi:MAG: hypothetical protein ACREBI_00700 [Nitrosotalea sp.]